MKPTESEQIASILDDVMLSVEFNHSGVDNDLAEERAKATTAIEAMLTAAEERVFAYWLAAIRAGEILPEHKSWQKFHDEYFRLSATETEGEK